MKTNRIASILRHMLRDAQEAVIIAEEAGSFENYHTDFRFRKTIAMSIINIGELTKQLPDEFKASYAEIPWRKISGMRDIVSHRYHAMENRIIWETVTKDIPELVDFLQQQLSRS